MNGKDYYKTLGVDRKASPKELKEAYRRLAAVTTEAEVDDIRAEWVDRFGPVPAAAEALLEVARLRAECVRTGVREVTVVKGPGFGGPRYIARLAPVVLPTSKVIRLKRLYKDTVYKEDSGQLQLPVSVAADAATTVIAALRELIPEAPADDPAISG